MNRFLLDNLIHKIKAFYYIYISKHHIMPTFKRGVGKTEYLIKYARKHKCKVVVYAEHYAKVLKHSYRYDEIYSVERMLKRGIKVSDIVVDECISIEKLYDLTLIHNVKLAYFDTQYWRLVYSNR